MTNDLIEIKEIGDYRIKVFYDIDAECPVTNWDMGANYLWEHLNNARYSLSSNCDWKEWVSDSRQYSMADILQRMAAEVVEQKAIIDYYKAGKVDNLRFAYNRHTHQWELQTYSNWKGKDAGWFTEYEVEPSELKVYDCRTELLEPLDEDDLIALIKECAKDFVIKEWDSTGYSQGDYMKGVAYTTKERFDKYCGFNPDKYKDWKEQALAIIETEVKEIGMWAWGDVKGVCFGKESSIHQEFPR